MADKSITIAMGTVGELHIKSTFENATLQAANVSINGTSSVLKDLVTLGALSDGTAGVIKFPVNPLKIGTEELTIVFNHVGDTDHANVENWGKATRTVSCTVTDYIAALSDVSTPLTMDLWATQNLTFKVMKAGNDITASSVTGVTVLASSIADKFEFTADNTAKTYQFKSIQSSSTEVVTATAKVTVTGTHNSTPFTLTADVVLRTNINNGSIPTNRFDVQFVE